MNEIGHGLSDYRATSYLERLVDPKKSDDYMLGRLKEYKSSGELLLRSQPAWRDNDLALDILGENRIPAQSKSLSSISVNRCRREFREMVAALSNLRPSENCVTANGDMASTVFKLNKRCKHWWGATFADRQYRTACQYALGLGTAYIEPWWDNNFWGYGCGDIALKVSGPSSVLPVMLTEDFNIQKAYAVTKVEEIPLHIVLANFPEFAGKLTANRKVPGWLSRAVERAKQKATDLWGILSSPMDVQGSDMPTVDVYRTFIMDMSVNDSGKVVPMGRPGTNWYYEVPYVGQEIPSGVTDPSGREMIAKAQPEDCLLFPLRRLAMWTDTCILDDNSSPYLHGRVPFIQLRFDDNPWDFLGYSIIHDTWRIQKSRNRMLRICENSFHTRMNPPLGWDENLLSQSAVDRLTAGGMAGKTVKSNFSMGDAIKPILPAQQFDIPGWALELIKYLDEAQADTSVVKDLVAMAKAKQVPSADSIEKLMEAAGQVPQDMARGGEKAICEMAALWFPLEIQFSTARQMMKVLGEDGITKEALDYTPGTLIPSHLPNEPKNKPSRFADWQRLRWTVEQLSFQIEPYSQAQISKIGRGLQLLQLVKAGMPIDPWTIAKPWNLDIGPEPAGTSNMIQRWLEYQKLRAEFQAEIAQMLGQGQEPQGEQRGRPQSNQKPPQIRNKDNGQRSTVVTSR